MNPVLDPLAAALADRYRIERELGHGGIATVYRTGDRKRAIDNYQCVAHAWRHGNPEVQPYVQESRAALQRLTGEPSQ
jgi:hypothetical protein